jgi:predicted protein tyrosine phosphatase
MTKPYIQNISRTNIIEGNHGPIDSSKDVLIQISDPGRIHPIPYRKFAEVHRFSFDDVEEEFTEDGERGISYTEAQTIALILVRCLDEERNVIVHCHAGLCRSGGIAQAGEALGFATGGREQVPNLLVKHRIMAALGLSYDDSELAKFTLLRRLMEGL